MNFTVSGTPAPKSGLPKTAWLQRDGWDDFGFRTMFKLTVFGFQGEPSIVGDVKIGEVGMVSGRPAVPTEFAKLDERFFSLGQDVSYYTKLAEMSSELRDDVLNALNDMAADRDLFDRMVNERAYKTSLLRHVQSVTVRRQFGRVLRGQAKLTPFHFEYSSAGEKPVTLTFRVTPDSVPPTNLHVLVGSNGVGKTQQITRMRDSRTFRRIEQVLSEPDFDSDQDSGQYFAHIVALRASAFDDQDDSRDARSSDECVRVTVVDISESNGENDPGGTSRLPRMKSAFVLAAMSSMIGARRQRFEDALQILMSDRLFEQSGILSIVKMKNAMPGETHFEQVFDQLSAGHRAVLIALTNLVLHVDERTLVLIDEPETHLHPPLLSAFIRALSNLLASRNGVAIIATHSPVVLQEVPGACVWKLRRSGNTTVAQRPQTETFGENVGILTHEVFGLEVASAGFYQMLNARVTAGRSYSEIVTEFGEQLGSEARAIASSLIAVRDRTLS